VIGSRRRKCGALVAGLLAVAAIASFTATASARSGHKSQTAGTTLTVAAWGAAYGAAEKAAYYVPFEKATGIKIKAIPAEPTLGALELQVKNHNVTWDVAELSGPDFSVACKKHEILKLSFKLAAHAAAPGAIAPCAVASSLFTQGIVYNKTVVKHAPTWKDFFNGSKYPGKRALEKFIPDGVIEDTLLGSGVSKRKLYPLNFNKAEATWKTLGGNLIWFDSEAQAVQLMASGNAVMAQLPTAEALGLLHSNHKLGYSLVGIRAPSSYVAPSGGRHKAQAVRFLKFIANCAKCSRTMAKMTGYAGANAAGDKKAPASVRKLLPSNPAVLKSTWSQNLTYWAKNDAALEKKFEVYLTTAG
jgi:putative spermidine/putrescine transport system substrate-binding protein